MKNVLRIAALAIIPCVLALPALAQAGSSDALQKQPVIATHPAADSTPSEWTVDQLIPLTVHDAWMKSGRDEAKFFEMVRVLTEYSAQRRDVVLPDSHADGIRFGRLIKTAAKADHDQLLYVVVDQAVRKVGKSTPVAAQ
jgi:hypothetical protein